MKAIIYTKYGAPDVLKLEEVPKPVPRDNEVLVKVHAASINPYEWHIMRGEPFVVRLTEGLFKPKHKILGNDMSGIVKTVGRNVKEFVPGDAVFGASKFGALAEYVCVAEDGLVKKPANSTFEEAATLPIAAMTALQGLRDDGKMKTGTVSPAGRQKVLINGASGGVGTFAVQIAKSFGAEVTAVCSTRNLEMVRSIGADHVVDYTRDDFTRQGESYDLIFDAVGNRSVADLRRALSARGIGVVAGFTSFTNLLDVVLQRPFRKKKIGLMGTKIDKQGLVSLKEFLETGKVKPVIDRQYSFNEITEAMAYLEEGHARGKVVIKVK